MNRITTPDLDKVNINNLDLYEKRELDRMIARGFKTENALQIIINSTEGDFTQLSEELREKAKRDISWTR